MSFFDASLIVSYFADLPAVCAAGFLLDRIIGDPYWLPHPVRAIGALVKFLERRLYPVEGDGKKNNIKEKDKENEKNEEKRGALLVILTILTTYVVSTFLVLLAYRLHRVAGIAVSVILCTYCLAGKSLKLESLRVYRALQQEDEQGAKKALSMIVGRDTAPLNTEQVVCATVETVAENASDGVVAPLFYLAIGGPVLALCYKAVNTMDSMIGYRNERYCHFGTAAARLDDVANFLPARISACCMLLSGCLYRALTHTLYPAYRIYKRDRNKHTSPNAAQCESVMAGLLGIRLNGGAFYGGVWKEKPYLGDALQSPKPDDIPRACRILDTTVWIAWFALEAVLVFGRILLSGAVFPPQFWLT